MQNLFMNKNQLQLFLSSFLVAILLGSCASNEIGQSKDVNQETIYQEYQFAYNESDKEAGLFSQFRFAGENGTTLILNSPSKIEYNGVTLGVDSNGFAGAFYYANIPLAKVIGRHSVVFTDYNNKKYENHFSVDSFYLTDVPATISKRAPALIKFKAPALGGDDYIELESEGTDSSFSVTYKAGEKATCITIPASELQRQKKDELFVKPTLYRKMGLQQQAKEGGKITTKQTLKPVKLQLVEEAL